MEIQEAITFFSKLNYGDKFFAVLDHYGGPPESQSHFKFVSLERIDGQYTLGYDVEGNELTQYTLLSVFVRGLGQVFYDSKTAESYLCEIGTQFDQDPQWQRRVQENRKRSLDHLDRVTAISVDINEFSAQ